MHDISFIHVREINEQNKGYCFFFFLIFASYCFKLLHLGYVCRTFMRHIVVSYYIWDNVCRTLMRHIVVSYYISDNVCRTFMRHIVVNYYIWDNVCRTFMRHNVVN